MDIAKLLEEVSKSFPNNVISLNSVPYKDSHIHIREIWVDAKNTKSRFSWYDNQDGITLDTHPISFKEQADALLISQITEEIQKYLDRLSIL